MAALPTRRAPALRRPALRWAVPAVLGAWIVLAVILAGRDTLPLGPSELTGLHRRLNDLNDAVGAARDADPLVHAVVATIRSGIDALVRFVQALIAQPSWGRPVPAVGWLGVVALATFGAGALGNLRVAALTATGLTVLGLQGLWQQSMDTLSLTLCAVLLALLLGLPIGIAAGLSDRAARIVTPVLDVAQTMPALVYLAPLSLFFLIGPASATITTLVYALPPVVRLTAHGIRTVPVDSVEAAVSVGATARQRLVHVQLPMARRTIVLGINQTMMAALSMVTVAALIDAPGLGKTVLKALETLDVGVAFNAGLAIVVLAVVLDRSTTAVAERAARVRPPSPDARLRRRSVLAAGAALTLWLVHASRTYLWAARFPDGVVTPSWHLDLRLGDDVARVANAASRALQVHAAGATSAVKDGATAVLVEPLQSVLAGGPWWVVLAGTGCLAALVAGSRAALTALVCLGLVIGTGLWADTMVTLASTLVATAVVLALGVAVGVWMGRDRRVDSVLRPMLDAGQTLPSFVYLVPFLALFAASRFTAIVAAVLYATPTSIKIVADGVRTVPAETVEAAMAFGSSPRQLIAKVLLPTARPAIALALNQGLMYVLSMVVVGGLVGGGALGYDVIAGFSQGDLFGKGLAAGAAIVLLGVLLDRVSQGAARRTGRPTRLPAQRGAAGLPAAAGHTVPSYRSGGAAAGPRVTPVRSGPDPVRDRTHQEVDRS